MNYQEVVDSPVKYTIREYLEALREGYKNSRLGNSLKENVLEAKWGKPADTQRLVYGLLELVSDKDLVTDKNKIQQLIDSI